MVDKEEKKPHLSATQLEMYSKCPEQYRRVYIEGERLPPGISLMKGSAFHHGAETNFTQKIESHEDLPEEDIIESAVEEFKTSTMGEYSLSEDESSRGATVVVGEATDSVGRMAKLHATKQAPDYQPVLVEKLVRIELPKLSRDLLAVIDLADDKNRIVDFKTAAKSKNQHDADVSTQLTIYAAAYRVETGEFPASQRLDVAVDLKSGTKRQVLESPRDHADFVALANRINTVTAAIEAGIFTPAPPGAWWCSSKFCGFYSSCPYVRKGIK